MADVVAAAFVRSGKSAMVAQEDAETAIRALSELFGGRMFYLPMAKSERLAARDERIWKDFDGKNVNALAQKYEMSEQSIYRVIAKMRARLRRSTEAGK